MIQGNDDDDDVGGSGGGGVVVSEAVHVLARDGASRGRGSEPAGDVVPLGVIVLDIVDVVDGGGESRVPRGAHSPSTPRVRRWR